MRSITDEPVDGLEDPCTGGCRVDCCGAFSADVAILSDGALLSAFFSFLGRGMGLPFASSGRGSRALRGFFSLGVSFLEEDGVVVESALRLRGGFAVTGCDDFW